jgi:hypothetical protein
MESIWMLLFFIACALIFPLIANRFGTWGMDDELESSFAEQHLVVDGVSVPAKDLEVLHRAMGSVTRDRGGDVSMDAQWLCRSREGAYWLGIAQGAREDGEFVIRWTWRHLTEERARHALLNDPKAYRAVFGNTRP